MSPKTFASKVRRRLVHIACRLIQKPRILFYRLLSNALLQRKPILHQPLQAVGSGVIEFSEGVNIGVYPSPFFFSTYAYIEARNSAAKVSIGEGTWINNGFCAIAEHTTIAVGKRVLIGTHVEVYDSDFHGLRVSERIKSNAEWALPVVIEDDVFIGSNVRILKGVTIGKGSVIANSALVTKDIPAGVVAGGNPARVIKMIADHE
jgi:acetyltransferase-like isoleucine patch superfamily enzyme